MVLAVLALIAAVAAVVVVVALPVLVDAAAVVALDLFGGAVARRDRALRDLWVLVAPVHAVRVAVAHPPGIRMMDEREREIRSQESSLIISEDSWRTRVMSPSH